MPGNKPMRHATSQAQQAFMGAELGRLRRGQRTQTDMSEAQLREFAKKPKGKKLPRRAKKKA